jgi:hypothetical protein
VNFCTWRTSVSNTNDDTQVIVNVFPKSGTQNLTADNGFKNVHPIAIGTSKVETLQSTFGGGCEITFVLSATSSIMVDSSVLSTDQTKSCKLAIAMAQAIEPNIPTS